MADKQAPIIIEEVMDPEELAKARAQRERFDRNTAWLNVVCLLGQRHRYTIEQR